MWVAVRCDPDIAAFREEQRPDRAEGMARRQALSVQGGVAYDVEVDTTKSSTESCAGEIALQLALRTRAR